MSCMTLVIKDKHVGDTWKPCVTPPRHDQGNDQFGEGRKREWEGNEGKRKKRKRKEREEGKQWGFLQPMALRWLDFV